MKRSIMIVWALLLMGIMLVAGCSTNANSDYRSRPGDQGRTYNAPQGQYGGGCGVTAPVEGDHEGIVIATDAGF